MKILNCLIIEDEPIAAEIIASYIAEISHLRLVASLENAIDAASVMINKKVDVVFLDINLPKIQGMQFLKTLDKPPQAIITTAYHEHAIEGFELNIVDYLLKPIEFSRFLKAVNKLKIIPDHQVIIAEKNKRDFRFFNVNKKNVKIFLDEILYIESYKEYVKIHLENRQLTTKFQLGEVLEILNEKDFLRIHRSYIISIAKIESYSPSGIEINDIIIPIGRTYKEKTIKTLEQMANRT